MIAHRLKYTIFPIAQYRTVLFFLFLFTTLISLPLPTYAQDGCTQAPIGSGVFSTLISAGKGTNSIAAQTQTSAAVQTTICQPVPRIKIPGLSFTSTNNFESLIERDVQGNITAYHIPFLGQYLSAIYQYAIALAGVVCIFMLILSGVQWMLYGTNPDSVDAAKERIRHTLTGLILIVSSYTILYTIDPKLVRFESLRVDVIQKIDYVQLANQMIQNQNGRITFTPISDGQTHRASPGPDQPLSETEVLDIVKTTGLNPCIAVGIYKTEAGSAHSIGDDESVRRCNIRSRRYFLASGIKYSGERFVPPQGSDPAAYTGDDCAVQITNDDTFNLNAPPDYGLDWRFSHGIGLGQYTIFPDYTYPDARHRESNQRIAGPNGPEWARYSSIANRWYTVTDLLNPDIAFEATLGLMVRCHEKYTAAGNNAIEFRNCYGGGNDPLNPTEWDRNNPPEPRFMRNYCQCLTDHGPTLGLGPDQLCAYY